MLRKFLSTDNSATTIFIRLMVGVIFLSEGIQKFLFPMELGVGRFTKIGFPDPAFLAGFVGVFEILCGTLVLIGLLTRFACIPLFIIMIVSISTTKIPLLHEHGIWNMLHEIRVDWAMLLGSIFLLIKGAGNFSLDKKFFSNES